MVAGIGVACTCAPLLIGASDTHKPSEYAGLRKLANLTLLYTQDFDNTFPLAFAQRNDGSWGWNSWTLVPEDWSNSGPWADPDRRRRASGVFPNSLRSYGNVDEVMGVAHFKVLRHPSDTRDFEMPNRPWTSCAFAINGLLHVLSVNAVARPERLTLAWPSLGKVAREGRIIASPTLWCDGALTSGAKDCRFHPTAPPSKGSSRGSAWFWTTHGKDQLDFGHAGAPFANTDGSLRHIQLQPTSIDGQRNPLVEDRHNFPFEQFGPDGSPLSLWSCTAAGATASYSCFFRPDNTFER
jgi:hypothetical protein